MSIEDFLIHVEKLLSNPILWGVTAILAVALALSGRVSMTAATWLVWLAWAMAVFGVYRAAVYFGTDVVLRLLAVATAASIFAIGAVVLNRWFTAPKVNLNEQASSPPAPAKREGPPKTDTAAPKPASPLSVDPVGNLSRLGWTVKRDSGLLTFEVMSKPIPPMKDSQQYFAQLNEPFSLHLQSVPNLDGVERLWGIETCKEIVLSASDLTSISQLSGFKSLQKLEISQVPLNTHENIDSAPLAGLSNLTSLVLNSRVSDLTFVVRLLRLQRLVMEGTLIRDISPVRSLPNLKVLDVRDSQVSDISPISANMQLEELVIDMKQVSSLNKLSDLQRLQKLTVIGQLPVDLSPIGNLSTLQSLFVWGSPFMNLGFLGKLPNLTDLQISGFGAPIGPRSQVTGSEAICAGGKLNALTLGALEIHSLDFATRCKSLTELNLRDIPLASFNDLASMQNLKKVSLADIPVVEISPLLALPSLESLSLIRVPARADVVAALERRGVKVQNP